MITFHPQHSPIIIGASSACGPTNQNMRFKNACQGKTARKGQLSASPSHHECDNCQYYLHFIGQNLLYSPKLTVGKTMKHTEACGYLVRMSTLRHIAFIVNPFVTESGDI